MVFAAVSHEMEGIGGKYLEDMKMVSSSRYSYRRQEQEALWNQTVNSIGSWIQLFKTQNPSLTNEAQECYDIFID